MKYKTTEHYARGEEKLIAEFNDLDNAYLFIEKKSSKSAESSIKILYRIYQDQKLIKALNPENISTIHAKYADGNGDFENAEPFIFQVIIKQIDSTETEVIAHFNDIKDAKFFIYCLLDDSDAHDNNLFLIYKDKILMDSINKNTTLNSKLKASSSEKGSGYRLSPLSTRPTPGGGPPDYWVKNEDED